MNNAYVEASHVALPEIASPVYFYNLYVENALQPHLENQ